MRISVILMQDASESKLRKQLETNPVIEVVDVCAPDQWNQIPGPGLSVPEVFVVVNADAVANRVAVVTGLLLRNVGHQVFISSQVDCDDLLELMRDAHEFISNIEDKEAPFRTEVLITDHAIEILGDVSSTIDYFEREFLT